MSKTHTSNALDAFLAFLELMAGSSMWLVDVSLTHLHHHLTLNVKPFDFAEMVILSFLALLQVRMLRPAYHLQSWVVKAVDGRSIGWAAGSRRLQKQIQRHG